MRFYQTILTLILCAALFSCASEQRPHTPLETLKAYTQAIKKKDTATMKELLSKDSIKMAQNEAKEQSVPLGKIIEQESLFSSDQKAVEFRNEKITGDKATIEMKDSTGIWNTVQFINEDGDWKIDKKGYADELMKQAEEDNRRLEEQINKSREN